MNDREISQVTGLAHSRVKEIRLGFDEGTDWVRAGKESTWTDQGIARLQEFLNLAEKIAAPEKKPPAETTLHVAKIPMNPKILLCSIEKNGPPTLRLRVRSTVNFRVGMEVDRCRHEGGDVYTMGRNCPRYPGRW